MNKRRSKVSSLAPDSEQPKSALRTLRLLVRNGLPREHTIESPSQLQAEIHKVLESLEPSLSRFSLLDSLMYQSLLAESHAMFGRIDDAIKVLEPAPGKGPAVEMLSFLDASARAGRAQLPENYLADKKLLRQAIWLLMNYLFFRFYEKGSYEPCLQHLTQLETVILGDLKSANHIPNGTLSRLYYYRSHCFRGLRRFVDVERDLMRSQEHANQRLKHKLNSPAALSESQNILGKKAIDPLSISEHRDFAIICTARILAFGFGWTELNRGRLSRARRLLLSAETLLLPSGHQAMKQLVQFLLAIIERRLSTPGSPEYEQAILNIKMQREIYASMKSSVGELRAVQELARAYLDWVDLLDWSTKQNDHEQRRSVLLNEARTIGDQFKELSETAEAHWKCRYKFIDVRLACQLDNPRYDIERKLLELKELIEDGQPEFEIPYHVLQGYVFNRLAKWASSIDPLQEALKGIGNDPLLEAEIRLLLAESFVGTNNLVKAEEESSRWATLSQSVQNCYLRNFAAHVDGIIESSRRPFHIDFYGGLDLDKNTKNLEIWLLRTAQKRCPDATENDVADLLRTTRSKINRKRHKYGLT
ncbi:MAG: hypothetical protein LAO20_18620 [Acidobacteriia bacterium]|nr:hypothetical protein [Terriglobia bacterium]